MSETVAKQILTLNSGSSSLKFSSYEMDGSEKLAFTGELARIGLRASHFAVRSGQGESLLDEHLDLPDHMAALKALFDWLKEADPRHLSAVGQRVVHGGSAYRRPQRVDADLLSALKHLIPLAPDHLPHEIKALEAVRRLYPDLPQVACFDTAFHRQMPQVAQQYPLPRTWWHAGVKRYGFHGLSYEYILNELRVEAGEKAAQGRVIIAHLGSGASMAAVLRGKCLDTTMGYTPTGGLVMGTRSGDLDPGVLLYLLEEKGLHAAALSQMLNHDAGLLGLSGISSDMQDLLGKENEEPAAAEAIQLFCYQARKFLGGLCTVLGGLDTLIFTAGIGENSPQIRARICQGLEFLGIRIDGRRNRLNAPIISPEDAPVTVRVMKTDEELMIARHTWQVLFSKT